MQIRQVFDLRISCLQRHTKVFQEVARAIVLDRNEAGERCESAKKNELEEFFDHGVSSI